MKKWVQENIRADLKGDYRDSLREPSRKDYQDFLEDECVDAIWLQYCLVVALICSSVLFIIMSF
jgi:hypothetical protein